MATDIAELTGLTLVDPIARSFTEVAMNLPEQFDFILCQTQCGNVIENPATDMLRNTRAFKAVNFPGPGHEVNFSSARQEFRFVTNFLVTNGLWLQIARLTL